MSKEDRGYMTFKLLARMSPPAGLLVLYFSGMSFLGFSIAVPYAFLWLVWTLAGIRDEQKKLNENLKRQRPEISA